MCVPLSILRQGCSSFCSVSIDGGRVTAYMFSQILFIEALRFISRRRSTTTHTHTPEPSVFTAKQEGHSDTEIHKSDADIFTLLQRYNP